MAAFSSITVPQLLGLMAASTAVQVVQGVNSANQQKRAANTAAEQARTQASQAEQQINKANAKQPDIAAMLSAAQQAARAGQAGTMLTGPAGVDPSALLLGRNTLLGG